MKDYYKTLEIDPKATIEQIKAQHHLLIHAWHPDKFPNAELKAKAEERIKEINEAYRVLSDPAKREIYDRELKFAGAPPPYPPPQSHSGQNSQTTKPKPLCKSCGMPGQLKYVEFYQNIGMIFLRKHGSVQGKLCKSCINFYFWNLTGITILLGWWGIISFIVTPFILLNNVLRYISTIGMRKPAVTIAPKPSPFWVFTTISGFLFISCITLSIIFFATVQAVSPSVKTYPTALPVPTRIISTAIKTTTSSASPCTKWTQITSSMIGKKVCVYGKVYAIYDTDQAAIRLKFSPEANTFFIYDSNYIYPDLRVGDCVMANEFLQLFGDIPFMSISSKLYKCESWMK